jgi:CelD/BcsL family acetyltransferase involved in cellulose biosynthesis
VDSHPRSSVFHTVSWLQALQRTYGYEPAAYTTTPTGASLRDGLVFCRVSSWITGRRVVSLPFSDHCEPLFDTEDAFLCAADAMRRAFAAELATHIELRPLTRPAVSTGFQQSDGFRFHRLDLRPPEEMIFARFHENCVQRKIRRALREGLRYETGRSPDLLLRFYRLHITTRRRQQLPPQPLSWFRNLAGWMGDNLTVHLASKHDQTVAGLLTLRHRRTVVYKYGCSDRAFSNLGGTQLLFWRVIQEAKRDGLLDFDLGRTDPSNEGLIRFKDRLGAAASALTYWRYPAPTERPIPGPLMGAAKRLISLLPDVCLAAAGRLVYRHLG